MHGDLADYDWGLGPWENVDDMNVSLPTEGVPDVDREDVVDSHLPSMAVAQRQQAF